MRKNVLLALTTVFLTLGLILVGGELALRATAGHMPKNDFKTVTWGHSVVNNALGYREHEVRIPKPPSVFRVMVLGDSLTWGAGLATDQRYSDLLQARLRNAVSGLEIEVLNFGVSGVSTTQERDILSKFAEIVEPDLVVVGFCVNDPQPRSQDYAVELDRYKWLFKAVRKMKQLHLYETVQFLSKRADTLLRNVGLVPQWIEALDRTYLPDSPQWVAFEGALRDIHALATARGQSSPLFIPLLQGSGDYNKPNEVLSNILQWTHKAATVAAATGFEVVLLDDAFRAEGPRIRYVLPPYDEHPDSTANKVYANTLEPFIRAAALKSAP